MKIDSNMVRAFAIISYIKENFPNFDGEIPEDYFYLIFRKLTKLAMSSFIFFRDDLRMLYILRKENKNYILNENSFKKNCENVLSMIEREEAERLKQQILKIFNNGNKGV